jgi:CheY-like chemotaxis protein
MSPLCFASASGARKSRQGTYVLHFAAFPEEVLDKLANGVLPELIVILSNINMPGTDGLTLQTAPPRSAGHDGNGLWRCD